MKTILPDKLPNPGSKASQALGCTCSVIDNHYGMGVPSDDGPNFWYSEDCPFHQMEDMPKETNG